MSSVPNPSEYDWAKLSIEAYKTLVEARANIMKAYGELQKSLGEAAESAATARKTNAEAAKLEQELKFRTNTIRRTLQALQTFERDRDKKIDYWEAALSLQEGQGLKTPFLRTRALTGIVYWITKLPVKATRIGDAERAVSNFYHPTKTITPPDSALCTHDRLLVQRYMHPQNVVAKIDEPAYLMLYRIMDSMAEAMAQKIDDAQEDVKAVRTRLTEIENALINIKPPPKPDPPKP